MFKPALVLALVVFSQCYSFAQKNKKAKPDPVKNSIVNPFVLSANDLSKFTNDDFRHAAKLFKKGYTPTTLSNGLIGISPGPNPLVHTLSARYIASTVVSGFVRNNPGIMIEELSPAPYPLAVDLGVEELNINDLQNKLTSKSQSLDIGVGEQTTELTTNVNGADIKLTVVQFASRYVPAVVCQKLSFVSNKEISISLYPHIEGEGADTTTYRGNNRWLSEVTSPDKPNVVDQSVGYISNSKSKLGVALLLQKAPGLSFKKSGHYVLHLKPNVNYDVKMFASMVADIYHPDPQLEAIRTVRWAEMIGFDDMQAKNRKIWQELWKSRIKINGASAEDQQGLDMAFYYIQSSIHSSSRLGIAPFALNQANDYFGHAFWDMDLWMVLPVLFVQPDAAKTMIQYRYEGLKGAQNKSALFGFRGALYPWETLVDGSEVCPSPATTAWAEQHTMTPALTAWEYYLSAAPNQDFLEDKVWPIIQNVAEFIVSRGEFTERGYEIKNVMGPDEFVSNISNQSYFNLLAKKVMLIAIECAGVLKRPIDPAWQKIADKIYLPLSEDKKAVLPYDPTSKVRVWYADKEEYVELPVTLKGESYSLGNLVYLFLHGLPIDDELFKSTYFVEEKIRAERIATDNTAGIPGATTTTSFPSPALMVAAAFCGERDKAAELFTNSWKPYSLPPYGMAMEYRDRTFGGFMTGLGSILQNTMLGLSGLRINSGEWNKYNATLPQGWESIEVDRIWIKGKPYKLLAKHGQKAELTLIEN